MITSRFDPSPFPQVDNETIHYPVVKKKGLGPLHRNQTLENVNSIGVSSIQLPFKLLKAYEEFSAKAHKKDLGSMIELGDFWLEISSLFLKEAEGSNNKMLNDQARRTTFESISWSTRALKKCRDEEGIRSIATNLMLLYRSRGELYDIPNWFDSMIKCMRKMKDYLEFYEMGQDFYESGEYEKALKCFLEAISTGEKEKESDLADVYFTLGEMLEKGEGLKGPDLQGALEHYEACLNKNLGVSAVYLTQIIDKLAHIYEYGLGDEKLGLNPKKAFDLYNVWKEEDKWYWNLEMAFHHRIRAFLYARLGRMHEEGRGTEADLEKANLCYIATEQLRNREAALFVNAV